MSRISQKQLAKSKKRRRLQSNTMRESFKTGRSCDLTTFDTKNISANSPPQSIPSKSGPEQAQSRAIKLPRTVNTSVLWKDPAGRWETKGIVYSHTSWTSWSADVRALCAALRGKTPERNRRLYTATDWAMSKSNTGASPCVRINSFQLCLLYYITT